MLHHAANFEGVGAGQRNGERKNGGIDIAAGYEHREERQETVPDNVQLAGDQLGFNAATASRTTTRVDSVFAELSLPIVTWSMNIPGVRSLGLGVAWRYEQ